MLEALQSSLGVVTTASKSVGIARQTHYQWLNEDEDYRAAVEELSEVALDFAESSLFQQIKNGNTVATIFYLKTKGRNRGYIERIEHRVTEEKPVEYMQIGDTKIEFLP